MPKPDLTPTQARVLADLAAGGEIEARWGTSTCYLFSGPGLETGYVSAATRDALVRQGYIQRREHSYPHRWCITPAGRDRAAQPAGASRAPAQEG